MKVADHALFTVDPTSRKLLEADLERITPAIACIDITSSSERQGPHATAGHMRSQLDAHLGAQLGATTGIELTLPYHPDYVHLRPAVLHVDAQMGHHAYHYCLRRYQDAMYTVTTAWPIARTLGKIHSGTMIAPTAALSRRLLGYPSPFERYMALLNLAEQADTLPIPTLLIGIDE